VAGGQAGIQLSFLFLQGLLLITMTHYYKYIMSCILWFFTQLFKYLKWILWARIYSSFIQFMVLLQG